MIARFLAIAAGAALIVVSGRASAADLVIPQNQSATRSGEHVYGTVHISGTLNVRAYDSEDEQSGWVYLRAHRIVVDAGATITAKGKGYVLDLAGGYSGPNPGGSPAKMGDLALPGGGGGHAGAGGTGRDTNCVSVSAAAGGAISENDPQNPAAYIFDTPSGRQQGMGSPGGASWAGLPNSDVRRAGSSGGGVVILEASEIEILGTIDVDGADLGSSLQGTGPGGGAAGTIVIRTNQLTVGLATVLSAQGAVGGTVGATYGGGGGGGLISIFAPGDFSTFVTGDQVKVAGGDDPAVCPASSPAGQAGVAAHIVETECLDADGDGVPSSVCGGDDCNDGDAAIRPGAEEVCNTLDDDCSGVVDDEDAPLLCSEGSGKICVAGVCEPDPDAVPQGGSAPLTIPEVELGGGLCAASPRGGSPGPWVLGAGLVAGGLWRRRRRARSR